MCTVLASILARVPNSVLRAKFMGATGVMVALVKRHKDEVGSWAALGGGWPCTHLGCYLKSGRAALQATHAPGIEPHAVHASLPGAPPAAPL